MFFSELKFHEYSPDVFPDKLCEKDRGLSLDAVMPDLASLLRVPVLNRANSLNRFALKAPGTPHKEPWVGN